MTRYWWDEKKILKAKDILAKHTIYRSAIDELSKVFGKNVTPDALRSAFTRYGAGVEPASLLASGESFCRPVYEKNESWICRPDVGNSKVLVVSDLHCPHTNWDALMESVNRDGDADVLVIAGDLLECGQVTKFGKEINTTLEQDYWMLVEGLYPVVRMFPETLIIWGNHDFRPENMKRKEVHPAAHWMIGGRLDPLAHIHEDLPGHVEYESSPNGWKMQLGDVVIGHPKSYMGVTATGIEGRTVRKLRDGLANWGHDLGGVAIGHTHRTYYEIGTRGILMETGCMAHQGQYTYEGDLTRHPWQTGYGVLVFEDSKVVPEKSYTVALG